MLGWERPLWRLSHNNPTSTCVIPHASVEQSAVASAVPLSSLEAFDPVATGFRPDYDVVRRCAKIVGGVGGVDLFKVARGICAL